MFRWMLPQRIVWITCEHGGVQMDASKRDLQLHMNTLGPPFRWIPRQRDLLRNLNDVLYLLRMPQQMDLLLHTDTTRILCYVHYGCLNRWTHCCTWALLKLLKFMFVCYGCINRWPCCCTQTQPGFYVMFTMDASTNGPTVAHGHC